MPGASPQTRRVKILNANWRPASESEDERFELLIITDDDQPHPMAASAGSVSALLGMVQVNAVLAWDPVNRTLIAANLVGTMPWTETS